MRQFIGPSFQAMKICKNPFVPWTIVNFHKPIVSDREIHARLVFLDSQRPVRSPKYWI